MNSSIELYDNISVDVDVRIDGEGYPVTKEFGRRGIYLAIAGSAVLGAWGLICLVSGLINCGNLALLKQSLLMAITGM